MAIFLGAFVWHVFAPTVPVARFTFVMCRRGSVKDPAAYKWSSNTAF